MSACKDKVLDVFVTKDNYETDEAFFAPLWSVDVQELYINREGPSSTHDFVKEHIGTMATVVNDATEWVMPCMGKSNAIFGAKDDQLEVGDMLRIGHAGTRGFTQHVTVLEKKPVKIVRNGVFVGGGIGNDTEGVPLRCPFLIQPGATTFMQDDGEEVIDTISTTVYAHAEDTLGYWGNTADEGRSLTLDAPVTLKYDTKTVIGNAEPGATAVTPDPANVTDWFRLWHPRRTASGKQLFLGASGPKSAMPAAQGVGTMQGAPNAFAVQCNPGDIDLFVYRINVAVNVTQPPMRQLQVDTTANFATLAAAEKDALEKRHALAYAYRPNQTEHHYAGDLFYGMAFPSYKTHKYLDYGRLRCTLDHGVKAINWIKLVGYSMHQKRKHGVSWGAEEVQDDWIALHIDQVPGKVVSNNRAANGAFYVMHGGAPDDQFGGAIDVYETKPGGLYTYCFDCPTSSVRNLDMRFLNRKGEPAHFGRVHLWLQLSVAHG